MRQTSSGGLGSTLGKEERMIERDVQPITENIIPAHIGWLADAPFFIDEQQISSFYDAVVRPDGEQGDTQLEFTAKKAEQVIRTMNAKGGMSLGLGWIFFRHRPDSEWGGKGRE